MKKISFTKIIPSGNPTIILGHGEITRSELPYVANELMSSMHIHAEQVGILEEGNVPHLQMMGGEFCINATRSAVALLAFQGKITIEKNKLHNFGIITVSGSQSHIEYIVDTSEEGLLSTLTRSKKVCDHRFTSNPNLYTAIHLSDYNKTTTLTEVDRGISLINMPGISHLLLDMERYPMPKNWRKESQEWRRRFSLKELAASGIVWYNIKHENYKIWPIVYVKETNSEVMETACGSASLALTLLINYKRLQQSLPFYKILQPSGNFLYVISEDNKKEENLSTWIAGKTTIVAQGTAYVSKSS